MKKFIVSLLIVFVGLSFTIGQVLAAEKLVIMYEEKRDHSEKEMNKAIEHIAAQTDIEIVPVLVRSDWDNKLNLGLAAGEKLDIIQTKGMNRLVDLRSRGALQPITEALEKYGSNIKAALPAEAWKVVTDENGDIWSIPQENVFKKSFEAIAIRKDWREQLGMGPITTLEEFEDYLRKVKEADPAGNGQTLPLVSSRSPEAMLPIPFAYIWTEQPGRGHNGTSNYLDENGNITPIELHPGYIDMLATFARWYKEGLLYKENFNMDKKKFNDLMISNRAAAVVAWYSDIIRPWESLQKNVPEAEYEYLGLKTVNGNPYKLGGYVPARPQLGVVSYSKKVDEAIKLVDWVLTSPENLLALKVGLPDVDYKMEKKDGMYYMTDLKPDVDVKDRLNYAMSFYVHDEMQGRQPEPSWRWAHYYAGWDFLGQFEYVTNPDWYIAYDWTGTPVEVSLADAATFMEEAQAKIISGQTSIEKWDGILKRYMKMHGKNFIKEATKQYNAKKLD